MYRIGAAILLSLILTLLSDNLAHADIWRCPQAGGPDLFTNWLEDPRTCQKYEASADFNIQPSSSTTTPPYVVPSQPMPVAAPAAPPKTPREVTEPYTPVDEQQPYDYLYPYYPYGGGYWFPFISGHPRHHHGHHHGHASSHGGAANSSGHGGGHGGGGHR